MKRADPALIEAFETSRYAINDEVEAGWWWLSFCDPSLPEGSQFIGACIVKAAGMGLAVTASHLTGLNPGGEVQITGPLTDEQLPPEQPRWALLTREEIDAVDDAIDAAGE